jgi:CRP-like cAMP-binding protein
VFGFDCTLLGHGNYPASVTAIDEAKLLFVSKLDFQVLCLADPQVALKALRVVGFRLRRLVGIIEELSFTTVRHRLASFLLRLAQKIASSDNKSTTIGSVRLFLLRVDNLPIQFGVLATVQGSADFR